MTAAMAIPTTRKNDIQWLRAIAALEVVFWHSDLVTKHFSPDLVARSGYAPFGGMGVELFFIISGYIMCLNAPRYHSGSRWALGRAIRIYPLYWIFTGMIFLASVFNEDWQQQSLSDDPGIILRSLLILPQQNVPVLAVGWSLEHEMIFYAFITLALLMFRGMTRTVQILLALFLGLLGATGVLTGVGGSGAGWDYHLLSPYMLGFSIGWALCLAEERGGAWQRMTPAAILLILGLLAALAIAALERDLVLRFALATMIVIPVIMARPWLEPRHPLNRLAKMAGDASFSIYLSHWFVLSILGKLLDVADPPAGGAMPLRILAMAACAGIGMLVYRWLERPLDSGIRKALRFETNAKPVVPDFAMPSSTEGGKVR